MFRMVGGDDLNVSTIEKYASLSMHLVLALS